MNGRRLSILLVSVGNVAVAGAQWYIIWLFARFSGAEAVGVYASVIALTSPLFVSAQLGLRNLYITLQSVVRWRVYVLLRAVGIILASAAALGALALAAPAHAWALACPILLIKIANSAADLYFARIQRTDRMRTFGVLLVLDACCTVLVSTVAMVISGSVLTAVWASAAVAVGSAALTVLLAVATPPEGLLADRPFRDDARLLLVHGLPLALSQGIQSLLTYLPVAIVGWLGTTADIGVFSGAAYLVTFAHLLGASVQTAMLPEYRRRFEEGGAPALLRVILTNGYWCMALLSPLIAVAVAAGPGLLRLVYGPEFDIGRTAVLLFALAAVICLPTYLLSSFHLVLNRYWVMTFVGAGSVLGVGMGGVLGGPMAGLGAVEAGAMGVLAGIVCRYLGAELVARRTRLSRSAASAIHGGQR